MWQCGNVVMGLGKPTSALRASATADRHPPAEDILSIGSVLETGLGLKPPPLAGQALRHLGH
jgi:hypothetical protein